MFPAGIFFTNIGGVYLFEVMYGGIDHRPRLSKRVRGFVFIESITLPRNWTG